MLNYLGEKENDNKSFIEKLFGTRKKIDKKIEILSDLIKENMESIRKIQQNQAEQIASIYILEKRIKEIETSIIKAFGDTNMIKEDDSENISNRLLIKDLSGLYDLYIHSPLLLRISEDDRRELTNEIDKKLREVFKYFYSKKN